MFGQPLTAPYLSEDGALQQVYERAVVFSPDGSIRRAAFRSLGHDLGPPTASASESGEPGGTYFRETGHNVLWAFADFYRANDGETLLGLPLEEAVLEPDRFTQRFENGVLEYRYDLPASLAVQLAPLGRAYLDKHPLPTTQPEAAGLAVATSRPALSEALQIEASLARVFLKLGEEQTIVVRVSQRNGDPVEGATVLLRWIGGKSEYQERLPLTDKQGRTEWRWMDNDPVPGEIINVLIEATAEHASGTTLLQYGFGFSAAP